MSEKAMQAATDAARQRMRHTPDDDPLAGAIRAAIRAYLSALAEDPEAQEAPLHTVDHAIREEVARLKHIGEWDDADPFDLMLHAGDIAAEIATRAVLSDLRDHA